MRPLSSGASNRPGESGALIRDLSRRLVSMLELQAASSSTGGRRRSALVVEAGDAEPVERGGQLDISMDRQGLPGLISSVLYRPLIASRLVHCHRSFRDRSDRRLMPASASRSSEPDRCVLSIPIRMVDNVFQVEYAFLLAGSRWLLDRVGGPRSVAIGKRPASPGSCERRR